MMKPGDKVMLVGTQGLQGRLWIKADVVKAVHKNGLVVLGSDQFKYNAITGRCAGKQGGWTDPPRLKVWDDALWQRFQMESANAEMASQLWELGDAFKRLSRDHEKAAALWNSLPLSVQELAKKRGDA